MTDTIELKMSHREAEVLESSLCAVRGMLHVLAVHSLPGTDCFAATEHSSDLLCGLIQRVKVERGALT